MALPFFYPIKTRYYATATTSTSGAPVGTTVIAARCKYRGGYAVPSQAVTVASSGTQGFDVWAFIGNSATATVISSGTSFTSTTGTQGTPITVTSTVAVYLNPGDVVIASGTTAPGFFVTHVVDEF